LQVCFSVRNPEKADGPNEMNGKPGKKNEADQVTGYKIDNTQRGEDDP